MIVILIFKNAESEMEKWENFGSVYDQFIIGLFLLFLDRFLK